MNNYICCFDKEGRLIAALPSALKAAQIEALGIRGVAEMAALSSEDLEDRLWSFNFDKAMEKPGPSAAEVAEAFQNLIDSAEELIEKAKKEGGVAE